MIAYKLFRVLKDGNITPLFIDKTNRLPIGEWLQAESHPTKGYKYRPFWHCTNSPVAPHLTEKGRAWYKIEMEDFTEQKRPENQGGLWYLANKIKIIEKIPVINLSLTTIKVKAKVRKLRVKKGSEIIYIGDGATSLLRIKDHYVFNDNWITEYDKQLCDANDNTYNVISFEEIEDYVCDDSITIIEEYPINNWRWVKRSCVKLDKEVNVGDVLYVKLM